MKHLIILCGASGTGKTTIQNYLHEKYQLPRVITHTTRPMRINERNGIDYYFETQESFDRNHYFEFVNYDGQKYGSSKEALDKAWQNSELATIVLDSAGAKSYVEQLGHQIIIFHIQVNDQNQLRDRLIKRGDDLKIIDQRLQSNESQRDLKLPPELVPYTVDIVNDNWEETKRQIDDNIQKILFRNE